MGGAGGEVGPPSHRSASFCEQPLRVPPASPFGFDTCAPLHAALPQRCLEPQQWVVTPFPLSSSAFCSVSERAHKAARRADTVGVLSCPPLRLVRSF